MKDLLVLAVALGVVGICSSMRAFPIESREMVERLFQGVNSRITWDETNFLVDVSGRYAHCKYLHQDGPFQVDAKFQENGQSIGGLRSTYAGEEAHWGAVMQYLEAAMPRWTTDPSFRPQIERAQSFGCSVQPGCRDRIGRQMSIACVFSPAEKDPNEEKVYPNAEAFTPQQYIVAERTLGISWDRTFYLENLSGLDTDCSMIGKSTYAFTNTQRENEKNEEAGNNIHIDAMFGSSPNLGDTESAIVRVLDSWAKSEGRKLRNYPGIQVGCSLISDCKYGRQMYVVVACVYSTS